MGTTHMRHYTFIRPKIGLASFMILVVRFLRLQSQFGPLLRALRNPETKTS